MLKRHTYQMPKRHRIRVLLLHRTVLRTQRPKSTHTGASQRVVQAHFHEEEAHDELRSEAGHNRTPMRDVRPEYRHPRPVNRPSHRRAQ